MKRSLHSSPLFTMALHAGQTPDPVTGSRAVPIYQTTSYQFSSVEQGAAQFGLQEPGYIYSRIANPTVEVLENRLAALEGGSAALALSSGQAAITLTVLNLAGAGDNLVSSSALYGGTYNLFARTLPRFGIETRFNSLAEPEKIADLIDARTRAVYVESIGNPLNNVADLKMLSEVAHRAGLPLIVDNTVSTPCLLRPFEHGADLVVHSLTKFIGGHGSAIGGAIVEKGDFPWDNGRFTGFTAPDPSYNGLSFYSAFGPGSGGKQGTAFATRARAQLLRDLGPCLSPFNAFLFLQGLESLPLRMSRHCENALLVARRLAEHPAVSWVNYPGLPSHPDHDLAKAYFPDGQGAIVGFGVQGGMEAGIRLINSLKLISHLANIGDSKTLIIHPASTTHRQLSPEERQKSGVSDDYIRLSVGLENIEDIMEDLERGLEQAASARPGDHIGAQDQEAREGVKGCDRSS